MLIAQITDPHIKARGKLAYKKVDTETNLRRVVSHVKDLDPKPDVVLITGDLTDFGRPEEYELFRSLIAPLGLPFYVIPGNHDTREGMRQAFTDHHYLPAEGDYLHYAIEEYPLRLIGLDTTVPGKPQGTTRPLKPALNTWMFRIAKMPMHWGSFWKITDRFSSFCVVMSIAPYIRCGVGSRLLSHPVLPIMSRLIYEKVAPQTSHWNHLWFNYINGGTIGS